MPGAGARIIMITGMCPTCGSMGPGVVASSWSASSRLAAVEAVLAERERELLDLKGPCSTRGCRLHYAHAGPCDIRPSRARATAGDPHYCPPGCHPLRARDGVAPACADGCKRAKDHEGLCDDGQRR